MTVLGVDRLTLDPDVIREILAESYRDAALADLDMRSAVEALEPVRDACRAGESVYRVREVVLDRIGEAEDGSLREVLDHLRRHLEDRIVATALDEVVRAAAADPYEGWPILVARHAEALAHWNTEACRRILADAPDLPPETAESLELHRRGVELMFQERWAEADETFRVLAEDEAVDPAHRASFLARRGQIELYHQQRFARATELCREAIDLAPELGEPHCALGQCWLQEGHPATAREHLRRALELDPHDADAYTYTGRCAAAEGDHLSAESWFRRAVSEVPGSESGYLRLIEHFATHEFKRHRLEIDEWAARAVAVNGEHYSEPLAVAAQAYRDNREYDRAHEWSDRIIAEFPDRQKGYIQRAQTLMAQNDPDGAMAAIAEAQAVAPDNDTAWVWQGTFYEQMGDWAAARRSFESAAELCAPFRHAYLARAAGNGAKAGDLEECEQTLFGLLEAAPDDQSVRNSLLGVVRDHYDERRDPARAIAGYDRIRKILGAKFEADYRNYVGNAHYFAGDYEAAVPEYRLATEREPENAVFHRNLAGAYRELGRWDDAREKVEAAFDVDGNSDLRCENLATIDNAEGNALFSRGEYAESVPRYESAIENHPGLAVYHANLAGSLENLAASPDPAETLRRSAAALDRAIELDPEDEDYVRRRDRVRNRAAALDAYGPAVRNLAKAPPRVRLTLAADLTDLAVEDGRKLTPAFLNAIGEVRQWILADFGVEVPGVNVGLDEAFEPGHYSFRFDGVPVKSGDIRTDRRLYTGERERLAECDTEGEETQNPLNGNPAFWVDPEGAERLLEADAPVWEVLEYPVYDFASFALRNLKEMVDGETVLARLRAEGSEHLAAIRADPLRLEALTSVARGLAAEQAPVTRLSDVAGLVLDGDLASGSRTSLVERARRLPGIRERLKGTPDHYGYLTVGAGLARAIRESVWEEDSEPVLAMDPDLCQKALAAIRERVAEERSLVALLVEDPFVRPFTRRLVELEFPYLYVLSGEELPDGARERVIGEIDLAEGGGEIPRPTSWGGSA